MKLERRSQPQSTADSQWSVPDVLRDHVTRGSSCSERSATEQKPRFIEIASEISTIMRRWLEVCFIASAASAPSFGGSRRGTIVDTTVSSRTGQCKLLLTRPRRSRVTVLHVELIGRGSAALASTSLNLLDEGICKCGNDRVVCIVQMDRSRGATVMTLPPIARFLIAHGHRMRPIFVLEAKGPALAAVRVVKRLSGLNRRVRCFSSLENFEAECASKNDDAYLEAQSVACAIRRRQEWQSWLHTPPWREHVQGASAQLRESITKLRGGALAHKLAKTSIVGAQMTTRDHRRRPRGECVVRVDGEWYDLSNFDHPGGASSSHATRAWTSPTSSTRTISSRSVPRGGWAPSACMAQPMAAACGAIRAIRLLSSSPQSRRPVRRITSSSSVA